ncbi:serine/threonine-protein kinase PrkC [Clostridium puniceum]|uniref:non-specific serine/threonine protein kinase n=1 Tax=Clostridium puniceum TaxID=29367 RepID=A0A1S8TIC7_9CLOT|nr:Stk1 family PASTA domain-containing Ser/Thr kinase [Clostridium puniceum]OOM77553.1 serine/threonine-protein kinase PrkC [Clostridium puniceum]
MIGTLLLNRYKLLEKIGEGGMGIVYKAKCTLLNRFVAVKILKAELSDDEDFITRFKREANSIASLSHTNIVNVYDVGSENNINFIVMEYINGKTLKQLIKENVRLNSLKTVNIALQIAKALQYAHKNNIIHRDIKPDNILITEENIVKLTDFGIAKVADAGTLTNSNKIIGSVHYFSPEQAKGKFVDCRTDIYALGIVMYELITGQVPFNGETSISVAIMHIQEPVIPPIKVITDIPENINTIILKTLEKEPTNRFQTAKELTKVLKALKKNSNLEVNFNDKTIYATTVMMMKPDVTLCDTQIDSTVVINKETIPETIIIKNNRESLSNNSIIKNKKILLTVGLIILAIIIGILGKYISKDSSADADKKITSAENTVPEKNATLPKAEEKKLVPSLIGKTQEMAESVIVDNGFLLGNITTEYSDDFSKGLVIRQSPIVDTSYDKNGKIDLVISQGQKITQVAPQTRGNGNGNGKDKEDKNKKSKSNK